MTQPQCDIHSQFPYGVYEVADHEAVSSRYTDEAPSLARNAPLPTHLPRRHPLLESLVATFQVQDTLPPWWHSCVSDLTQVCPCLHPLLCRLSRAEFRQGTIDQKRWREWRTSSCPNRSLCNGWSTVERVEEQENQPVPCWQHYGPSLYWMLDKVLPPSEQKRAWMDQFVNRGNKAMPENLDLVITADPAWWLNMSNGRGWYTCMGSGDDRDPRIIGNWYDIGVLLAALVERGADCWTSESLIARTIVRLVEERPRRKAEATFSQGELPPSPQYRLALGRVYHNDLTAASTLLTHLIGFCEEHGLAWGCIGGTNVLSFAQNGLLGPVQIDKKTVRSSGVSFWRPEYVETPYLDGEASFSEPDLWEHGGYRTAPTLTIVPCRFPPSRTSGEHVCDKHAGVTTLALSESGMVKNEQSNNCDAFGPVTTAEEGEQ